MPHMVAQEHMGYVDALRYGSARNQATIAAALSAIGSAQATLVLTFTGDGIWTLSSNLTIPTNVSLLIPAGVAVFRPSGVTLTVQGAIIAPNYSWETGTGVTVRGIGGAMEISNLRGKQFHAIGDVEGVVVQGPNLGNFITLKGDVGGGFVGINLGRGAYAPPSGPDANGFAITLDNGAPASLFFGRPGFNPNVAFTNIGTWLGNGAGYTAPSHLVQCQTADVVIPGGGPWGSWSDRRLKTVQRPYLHGLAMLLDLPEPIVYTYNGKGGSINDGTEYIGMIAQDVQPVAPYMVYTYPANLNATDPAPTDLLAMNNGAMTYALVNAVRELASRVAALETAAHQHTGQGNASKDVPLVGATAVAAAASPDTDADTEEAPHPPRRRKH